MKWPHIRITNPSTDRSKHVRIAPSQARKSIYDVIYSNPDVIAANIHDWPSDELERMTENLVEIKLSVVDINNNILATFSIDEMKTMEVSTLSPYSDGHDSNGGVVEMVLHCQDKEISSPIVGKKLHRPSVLDAFMSPEAKLKKQLPSARTLMGGLYESLHDSQMMKMKEEYSAMAISPTLKK